MASTHVALVTADGTSNRRIGSTLYGYCTSGASTVAKSVSLYTGNGTTTDGTWASGDLVHGLTITVRFQYSNTATNPTLNVNGTGAKRIYKYGTTSPGISASTSWQANSVISLTYDTLLNSSGCWVMNDHLDDTTGGGGSVEYTLSGSGDDDEYTITATPTSGTATSATIPAANTTDAGVMTATDKTKLDGIETGAEVNVQSDWNEADNTSDAYILNKPTIPTKTSDLTNDSNFVSDANYVHTDNNFTNSDVTKLSGIEAGAQVNPTYTAVTGKPTANSSPSHGGTVTISQIKQSTTGQITATDRTITFPSISISYVGQVNYSSLNSGWTAPNHGVFTLFIEPSNSNAANVYIQDTTASVSDVCKLSSYGGQAASSAFPIISGHVYKIRTSSSNVQANARCYGRNYKIG